jgi:hypothetical protein
MFVILLMFNITSIVKACIYGTYSLWCYLIVLGYYLPYICVMIMRDKTSRLSSKFLKKWLM